MKPKNGRYTTTAGSSLDLRLELFASRRPGWAAGIVSGDLVVGGKPLAFLSFPLDAAKGVTIAKDGTKAIVSAGVRFGENNYRSGSQGTVRLAFTSPGRAELSLKCAKLGVDETFTIQWKDRFFRDLVIEIDKIEPTVFPAPFTYRGLSWSVKKVFERAGFKTVVRPSDRTVADIEGGWTDGELNDIMHRLRAANRDPWYCYVLVCSYYREDGKKDDTCEGIMFDVNPKRSDPAREGCAVFASAMRDYVEDEFAGMPKAVRDREYLMTLVHEVGHALNLVHSFDKRRKESLSVMNYPDKYQWGPDQYYDGFEFERAFDDLELLHLRHHSRSVTEPGYEGGAAWSTGNFKRVGDAEPPPPPPPDIANDAPAAKRWQRAYSTKLKKNNELLLSQLELKLTLPVATAMMGAPLQGQVELVAKKSLSLTTSLAYATHLLTVDVKRVPAGDWKEKRNPTLRCVRLRKQVVKPGTPLSAEVPLVYSSDGEYFPSAGDYEVRVRLLIGYQGQAHELYSRAVPLLVKPAVTAEEKSLQRIYRKPEVRRFLLLRGGAATAKTLADVQTISAARTVPGSLAKVALVEHANAVTTAALPGLAQYRGAAAAKEVIKELTPLRRSPSVLAASVERVKFAAKRGAMKKPGILIRSGRDR